MSDTPMTREPERCPTCGADDPDAAVLAIATSPEGWPLPCPDLWHHDTSDVPASTPMTDYWFRLATRKRRYHRRVILRQLLNQQKQLDRIEAKLDGPCKRESAVDD